MIIRTLPTMQQMRIASRISESLLEKQLKQPRLKLGVYMMRLVSPERHTAFMKLAMPSLLKQLHTGIICCSPLSQQHDIRSVPQQ